MSQAQRRRAKNKIDEQLTSPSAKTSSSDQQSSTFVHGLFAGVLLCIAVTVIVFVTFGTDVGVPQRAPLIAEKARQVPTATEEDGDGTSAEWDRDDEFAQRLAEWHAPGKVPCNIERRHVSELVSLCRSSFLPYCSFTWLFSRSQSEFMTKMGENGTVTDQPIIFTDALGDWPATKRWSKQAFRSGRYRNLTLKVGSPTTFIKKMFEMDYEQDRATLPEMVEAMGEEPSLYTFDIMHESLHQDLKIPEIFGGGEPGASPSDEWHKLTFSMGGSGSGMTFHEHEQAWTALFAGRKRWLIFNSHSIHNDPPPFRLSIDTENTKFMTTVYRQPKFQAWWKRQGHECVQEAGELMYIPRISPHAVLNMGETIAATGEHCAHFPGKVDNTSPQCLLLR